MSSGTTLWKAKLLILLTAAMALPLLAAQPADSMQRQQRIERHDGTLVPKTLVRLERVRKKVRDLVAGTELKEGESLLNRAQRDLAVLQQRIASARLRFRGAARATKHAAIELRNDLARILLPAKTTSLKNVKPSSGSTSP